MTHFVFFQSLKKWLLTFSKILFIFFVRFSISNQFSKIFGLVWSFVQNNRWSSMKLSPFQTLLNIFGPLKKQPFFQVHLNDLKSYIFFFKTVVFSEREISFYLEIDSFCYFIFNSIAFLFTFQQPVNFNKVIQKIICWILFSDKSIMRKCSK